MSIHFFQNTIHAIIPTHVEWVVAIGHAMWRFSWQGWGPLPQLWNRQPFGVPSSSMLAKHSALADILLLYPTPDEWHIAMKRVVSMGCSDKSGSLHIHWPIYTFYTSKIH
ncbi:hypothetical protein AB205_0127220 [Aquarana catesbeiana]|uniref:Uncharacterized protein n=1 Tax=Aquarana catesbeiana TaxID=8400 RepID=A0A2G9QG48_AQUCT|nr:hypothetical protein AB205_0127220 [Aquarana catesbeiana]